MANQNANTAAERKAAPASSGKRRSKRQKIIDVAREQFLKHGYEGTSVDSIVGLVGGSKSTLYNHVGNKEELFAAVIDDISQSASVPSLSERAGAVRETLLNFAESRLATVLSRTNIRILRLVIAEAERFPQLAKMYFGHAPGPSFQSLSAYFQMQKEAGNLPIDDADAAAEEFFGALLLKPILERLCGVNPPPGRDEIKARAKKAVDRFLEMQGVRE